MPFTSADPIRVGSSGGSGSATALACYGSLTAWSTPYLFRSEPERAARYQVMYGTTHAFLPQRNGIKPNTLHVTFDVVTIALLIVLGILTIQQR